MTANLIKGANVFTMGFLINCFGSVFNSHWQLSSNEYLMQINHFKIVLRELFNTFLQ